MKTIKIGMIGSGYIGKTHAIAYAAANTCFSLSRRIVKEYIAEKDASLAEHAAQQLGFERWTQDWRALVNDPEIDIVDICSPNFMHKEMAIEAAKAGKTIYCEKPLGLNGEEALEMVKAAEAAGVKTLVGFNYIFNPATALAKEMIEAGEIGDIIHFRGVHNEDYLADPKVPMGWRLTQKTGGAGALGDLGAHIIHMAEHLVGPFAEICADTQTVIKERPLPDGEGMGLVENEDQAQLLVRFVNGALGSVETSRIATGKKMGLSYTITGTKGTIFFDQERMSEIKVFYNDDPSARQGFRTILAGPEHPYYAGFCQAGGHGVGFNDQKIAEVKTLIDNLDSDQPLGPSFRDGLRINQLIDAVIQSANARTWITTSPQG